MECRAVTQVEKISRIQWKELMDSSSTSSFFQSPECFDFYASLGFMEPFAIGVLEDGVLKGIIVGYIHKDGNAVKNFFTRRAIINSGPMLADDISEYSVGLLLDECRSLLSSKSIYIETRNYHDYSRWRPAFQKSGFRYESHYDFHIDTSAEEIVDGNMARSRKRDIRYSLRSGAVVISEPSLDEIRDFYHILSKLYREKIKTPLFPFVFFEKLYMSGLGMYRIVEYEGTVIGGVLCVGIEGDVVYEWFVCGEDRKIKNVHPSTLATYSGMQLSLEKGCRVFDMMGAGRPGDSYGVREFKSKFGGKLVEHGRYIRVNSPLLYGIGKLGVRILKIL